MPLTAARLEKLDGFLRAVTPATAVRLAQAVEFDRARGGALPHDEILQALRPHLRMAGGNAERVVTAQRLICMAFEDILVNGRRHKQRGRVARESISIVWSWLARQLGEEGAKALDAVTSKLVASGPDFARDEVTAFQEMAAAAILQAVPEPGKEGPAARALGADVASDAYDMARMMQIGPEIHELQISLKRPIFSLDEDDIFEIREVWERVQEAKPDCAPYVAFFVLGRLHKPWEIMRLAGALSRKMDDILISRTDAGNVGEILLSDLEDCVERLRAVRADAVSAERVLGPLEMFGQISTGIVRELGIKRDGIWGKRLMAARSEMAGEMERILSRAVRDISATLPMARRGLTLRARRIPDLTKKPETDKMARAIEIASVVSGARPHALAGAFAGMLSEIEEKVSDLLRHYTEELVDELLTVEEGLKTQALVHAGHAVELTRIVLGPDEGDLVRRRVAAASSPATPDETLVA